MGKRLATRLILAVTVAGLLLAQPLAAQPVQPGLADRIEAILSQAPAGTRYGVIVTDMDGHELLATAPDQRFIPGSVTKIFTTATAWAHIATLDAAPSGAGVRLEPVKKKGRNDVVLIGRGDARLSSADDCKIDCLAALADAIAAKTKRVHDLIGDDSFFPDQRWSPGMSWNNIPTESGTGISALTLDDNELPLMVTPGAIGAPPKVEGLPYYRIDNRALTVAGAESHIDYWRDPSSDLVRIMGSIGAQAQPRALRLGIDDPAHYAAWRLRTMLQVRGVKVKGAVGVRHRPLLPSDNPKPAMSPMLAELPSLPVAEDILLTNKPSQNLHAELLLRRVGALDGSGSIADGEAVVTQLMDQAGVPRAGYELADGAGMSTYNRASPRATATLLRWIATQAWGAAWRETLPIGGKDGTLRRRFIGTSLEGRVFAKTGSLNASRALAGYMIAKSGRMLSSRSSPTTLPTTQAASPSARWTQRWSLLPRLISQQPAAHRAGEIGRVRRFQPFGVDSRDERAQWQTRVLRRLFQGDPEDRLQTDRRGVAGDGHAALDRRVKKHGHATSLSSLPSTQIRFIWGRSG